MQIYYIISVWRNTTENALSGHLNKRQLEQMSLEQGLLVPIAQVKSQVLRVGEWRGSPHTVLLSSPCSPRPGGRAAGSGTNGKSEQFADAQ